MPIGSQLVKQKQVPRSCFLFLAPERLYHLAMVSGAHFTPGMVLIVILAPLVVETWPGVSNRLCHAELQDDENEKKKYFLYLRSIVSSWCQPCVQYLIFSSFFKNNPGRQWLNGSIVQILFVQVYFLCISSTGGRKSTPLICSLVGLHGGCGAWRMNLSTKLYG